MEPSGYEPSFSRSCGKVTDENPQKEKRINKIIRTTTTTSNNVRTMKQQIPQRQGPSSEKTIKSFSQLTSKHLITRTPIGRIRPQSSEYNTEKTEYDNTNRLQNLNVLRSRTERNKKSMNVRFNVNENRNLLENKKKCSYPVRPVPEITELTNKFKTLSISTPFETKRNAMEIKNSKTVHWKIMNPTEKNVPKRVAEVTSYEDFVQYFLRNSNQKKISKSANVREVDDVDSYENFEKVLSRRRLQMIGLEFPKIDQKYGAFR